MSESETPKVPKKSGAGLWLFAGGLLLGAGAWVVLGRSAPGEEQAPEPLASASIPVETTRKPEHAPPPPPPPPDTAAAEAEPTGTAAKASVKAKAVAKPTGCSSPCSGKSHAALESALSGRGQQARSCYTTALRSDEGLQGKLTVRLRVGADGRACSAEIADDSLGSAPLNACILSRFRGASYPLPRGGCVDVAVPLKFVAKP